MRLHRFAPDNQFGISFVVIHAASVRLSGVLLNIQRARVLAVPNHKTNMNNDHWINNKLPLTHTIFNRIEANRDNKVKHLTMRK